MALTENALAVIPSSGVDTYRMSTDAATITRELVMATALTIQGRKYVKAEGWQAIAIAHGCSASACNVERVDGGFRATGQVRRMDTGTVIAEAEGFVGEDEPVWFGGKDARGKTYQKRPDFAIRAMAQTRAISRACRSAFAHVVVQIDKNLGTTPAEEMQGVYDHDPGPHIIGATIDRASITEEARRDGILTNPSDDRSTYQIEAAKKAKEWTDTAIQTINLSGQTKDSLSTWWKANQRKLDGLEERHPTQYERVLTAYDAAMTSAEARAA